MHQLRAQVDAACLRLYVTAEAALALARDRQRSDERGEGVISAAIAVLVMAFLGVLMWAAFKGIFTKAAANTDRQVTEIGG